MAGPKSFFLTPEIHEYVVAHGTPPDAVQQALIDGDRRAADGDDADLARAGRVHDPAHARDRRAAGRRGGHVHRVLGARDRARPARRRPPAVLRRERGVDEHRPDGRGPRPASTARSSSCIAPAADTLRALPDEEYVDLAFIDADKPSYPVYYEELLRRLRPNGLILVDNTLWGGAIVDATNDDESTVAIRAFNDMVAADDRVESALLTLGDGLTLLRKR